MKTTKTRLKTSLVGLFLIVAANLVAQAQSLPPSTQSPPLPMGVDKLGPANPAEAGGLSREALFATETPPLDFANELTNAILFYREDGSGTGLTLVASALEDHETRNEPFTAYRWFYLGQNPDAASLIPLPFSLGTAVNIPAEGTLQIVDTDVDAHKITVNGLTPGYHIFQVEGIMNPDGAADTELCEPLTETIIIYVLPPLTVTATGVPSGDFFQYCEIDAITHAAGTISSEVQFTATAPEYTPNVSEFEKRYRFYAIKQQEDDSYAVFDGSNIEANPILSTGVTLLNDPGDLSNSSGAIDDFVPRMAEYGKYQILLEVEYTVKDRQFGTDGDDGTTRVRPHAIYRNLVMAEDGTTPLEIIVTPKPGKPHITIENVLD